MARLIMVGERDRRPATAAKDRVAGRDRPSEGLGVPRSPEKLPVEDEVVTRCEARCGLDGPIEELADGHPPGLPVDDRPEPGDEVREVRLVTVVPMHLPAPRRGPLLGWIREQLRML